MVDPISGATGVYLSVWAILAGASGIIAAGGAYWHLFARMGAAERSVTSNSESVGKLGERVDTLERREERRRGREEVSGITDVTRVRRHVDTSPRGV